MPKLTYDELFDACTKKGITLSWTRDEFEAKYKNRKDKPMVKCTKCETPHSIDISSLRTRIEYGKFCKSCMNCKKSEFQTERQSGKDVIINLQQEYNGFVYLEQYVKESGIIKKTFDKCTADAVFHKGNEEECMAIQIKTTSVINKGGFYSFAMNGNCYQGMLLCLICINGPMWLIPYDKLKSKAKTINITINQSPTYDKFKVKQEYISHQIMKYYQELPHFPFYQLNQAKDDGTQKEQEFKRMRETYLPNITFLNPIHEGENWDFKIGTKKVQEKVGTELSFDLKHNKKPYSIRDNDLYWFHYKRNESSFFYLIPELYLVSKKNKGFLITTLSMSSGNMEKYKDFLFDYSHIDMTRLFSIIN
jgi:hypothetical protein